jgi:transposase InsO family protein
VSEKSTRNNLDYTVESRAARNRSVFRPEFQLCPCHTAEEPYNSSESGLKKEIPDNTVSEVRAGIGRYIQFYNSIRPHSSLDVLTPDQVYFNRLPESLAA